jgi:hypothetical protein
LNGRHSAATSTEGETVIRKIFARAFLSFLIGMTTFLVACNPQGATGSRNGNKKTDEVTIYVSASLKSTDP